MKEETNAFYINLEQKFIQLKWKNKTRVKSFRTHIHRISTHPHETKLLDKKEKLTGHKNGK
jgi:hypothetical protein